MTIINNSRNFIFIHVPKTAGTSLKLCLNKFSAAGDICLQGREPVKTGFNRAASSMRLGKHSRAIDIHTAVGHAAFESFFKFSIVRNPFERARSIFDFLKFKFRAWPNSNVMDRFDTLEQMVASDFFRRPGPGWIFEPQTGWLILDDGKICVDFLGHVESFDRDVIEICRKLALEVPQTRIKRTNVSVPPGTQERSEITPAVVDAVRSRYSVDFDLLGYSREPCEQARGRAH